MNNPSYNNHHNYNNRSNNNTSLKINPSQSLIISLLNKAPNNNQKIQFSKTSPNPKNDFI